MRVACRHKGEMTGLKEATRLQGLLTITKGGATKQQKEAIRLQRLLIEAE